jgi:hypothetical protein
MNEEIDSPQLRQFLNQVETALIEAAADARELAERTGTPLVVRDAKENQAGDHTGSSPNLQKEAVLASGEGD